MRVWQGDVLLQTPAAAGRGAAAARARQPNFCSAGAGSSVWAAPGSARGRNPAAAPRQQAGRVPAWQAPPAGTGLSLKERPRRGARYRRTPLPASILPLPPAAPRSPLGTHRPSLPARRAASPPPLPHLPHPHLSRPPLSGSPRSVWRPPPSPPRFSRELGMPPPPPPRRGRHSGGASDVGSFPESQ